MLVQKIFSIYSEPIRLDRFLRAVFGAIATQGKIEKDCRKKQILVNGLRAEPKTRILLKDEISFATEAFFVLFPPKQNKTEMGTIKALVLQDFPDFCVIHKPYGLPSQGGPGITDSVAQRAGANYWLVHRLDRNTEGVMLLAKNRAAAAALTEMFKTRQIQKYYYAVVRGRPERDSGVIDVPLKNVCIEGEDQMIPDPAGQTAVTRYRVVRPLSSQHTLVLLKPLTGRKHQLRAHMLTLGTPILGDAKYGRRAKRMQLYAYKLHFVFQGQEISVALQETPREVLA